MDFLFPVVFQLLSCVRLLVTPWTAAHQASLTFTISWSLLKFSPLSRWCHPTISSSVGPFSSWPQSLQASGSFPISQLFPSLQSLSWADSLWPHGLQHTRPPCPSPILACTQTQVHWVGDAMQTSHPLSSPFPPALNLSQHQCLFKWVTSLLRWPKYWSFSFNISPSNEYPGLNSFRMDWLDLLAVQGTLKSLLQHHSSKESILQHSAFFIVQLSHPYMTTRKIIALTRWTFVGKVTSLLFNMLSRLVITFLPRSKCLLISWLQSQ